MPPYLSSEAPGPKEKESGVDAIRKKRKRGNTEIRQ
ncbi:hypothetical protein CABS01_11411 [Colletotrichum abscissum]|uniref:Uncharacterized protein n=1 Tax=Colletotrichum melonis TaxID=1209925 RepID=A0AAI9U8A9_9PEZI|nr:uncharacterized protein CABS01_11411 [Colletotrichum abscissum]KAK1453582.1 hypothetical protein CMEL01_05241 [Colletotrichum melonis]KAK1494395.1 hypothetical protein CABS01_11411 [Colletotrichum abscissum]